MYPYIHIFGRTIGSYAVASLLGFALSTLLVLMLCRRRGIVDADVVLLTVSVAVGVFVGGKLLYGLTQWKQIISAFAEFTNLNGLWAQLSVAFNGMVFYGGFIGSMVMLWLYTHFSKAIPRPLAFDLLGLVTPLFHAFGRIGCFLGGCCYGVPCSWGITVVDNPVLPELNGITRLPVQLIEAGCNLVIFLVLLFLFRRKHRQLPILRVYILLYAPVRFILEFFRGDLIRGIWLGLSTSQWISLLLLAAATTQWLFSRNKKVDSLS